MSQGRSGAMALCLVLVLGGCDSEEDPWTPVIQELCTAYDECCEARDTPVSHWACVAQLGRDVAGKPYDTNEGIDCLVAVQVARHGLGLCTNPRQNRSVRRACANLLAGPTPIGHQAPGETCEKNADCSLPLDATSTECASRLVVVDGRETTEDTCRARLIGRPGDRCQDTPWELQVQCDREDGLFCDSTGDKTCRSLLAEGAFCERHEMCGVDLACVEGRCVKGPGVGAECYAAGGGSCGDSLYCYVEAGVCYDRKADGKYCFYAEQCLSGSCLEDHCRPSTRELEVRCYR